MRISNVVHAIVEQELIGKGDIDKALYINLDLRMSHHINGKSYDQSRGLHLLYHVNPKMTYVSVFSGVTASPFAKIREVKEWKHECTHDSCWRDIQTFSQVYFAMADGINDAMQHDGLERIAPREMHEWSNFGKRLYTWESVVITKDMNDSYRRMITLK